MIVQVWVLIVAIYGPMATLDHKPHEYAKFYTKDSCKEAAEHFEARTALKGSVPVAICTEQKTNIVPSAPQNVRPLS